MAYVVDSSQYGYNCNAWLDDNQQQPALTSNLAGIPLLFIQLFTQIAPQTPTLTYSLLVPRDQLNSPLATVMLSRRLTEIQIPMDTHPIVITRINECALQILDGDGREVIGMCVVLTDVILGEEQEEESSEAMIKKVRVYGGEGGGEETAGSCVICMEEFGIGSEAARMGCLHSYHVDCIRNWLCKSPTCPLCRFSPYCN